MEYSADFIKSILARHGKNLKKSLGQNFLFDRSVLDAIVGAAVEADCKNIVEIGAGVGILTDLLCQNAARVVTVEIDDSLLPLLRETVPHPNFTLKLSDILKTDLTSLSKDSFGGETFAVVGNLPYYITAKILDVLAVNKALLERAVIMVQKEVALRLQSHVGSKEYRAATVIMQALFDIRYVCDVPPHCFVPAPHVDSAVIALIPKENCPIQSADTEAFIRFVKACFASRRKQLKGLAPSLGTNAERVAQSLGSLGLAPSSRAEALTPEQLSALFYSLKK